MQRDLGSYLCDIEDACSRIQRYTSKFSFEQYVADDMARMAVERCFEIIGEALSQASRNFDEVEQMLPELRQIIGLRNVLIHQYADVDDSKVWNAVQHDIAPMLAVVRERLRQIDHND